MLRKLHHILRQMRFGIAVAALVVIGTALYVRFYGPLYGAWGWPELVLGGLFLAASAMAGIEMAARNPNPYGRIYPLYNLQDVPPARGLDSGGAGWMIQALPSVVLFAILSGIFLIF